MTQERPISTKALSAYLRSRHTSLSAVLFKLGLNQKLLNQETIDADTLGRAARLLAFTPEQLTQLVAPFA